MPDTDFKWNIKLKNKIKYTIRECSQSDPQLFSHFFTLRKTSTSHMKWRLICMQLVLHVLLLWCGNLVSPQKEGLGGTSSEPDPCMHVFKFLQLLRRMLYEPRGWRNFLSPRGSCDLSNGPLHPTTTLNWSWEVFRLTRERESGGCSLFGGEYVILPWPECVFRSECDLWCGQRCV